MDSTHICPKCMKSREFYEVTEKDPKAKKYWIITRCRSCGFNKEIEAASNAITRKKTVDPSDKHYWGTLE